MPGTASIGRSPIMFRKVFALMDSDGHGPISFQEFQAAHDRIFKAMDANKDGQITEDEMQAFMRGTTRSGP
ncbi:EF-hand domain-containing protein [Bradyrhizobium guangdongense]